MASHFAYSPPVSRVKKIRFIVFGFVFLLIAVSLAAGMDWISSRAFGVVLLLVFGVLVATPVFCVGWWLKLRRAKDTVTKQSTPGSVEDEQTRRSLERIIRTAKGWVVTLTIGLIGASLSGIPLTVKIVGGIVDVGIIAATLGYITLLRRELATRLETSRSDR